MNLKSLYAAVLGAIARAAGMDAAKQFDAMLRFRRRLNLKEPKTLADKVAYLELHAQSPLAQLCTDKYEARAYVARKGYAGLLIPLVGGVWTDAAAVDLDSLPESFVLKATHGCKMNYMVPDKSGIDVARCRREMERWMNTIYGTYSMEPHYAAIQPRIYAEAYLGDASGLTDYKFHCLNGVPQFVLTVTNRRADGDRAMRATLDMFDMEWRPIHQLVRANSERPGTGRVPRPRCLEEMVRISTDLSRDFKFVRVDLYEVDGQVRFGELTFSPACCVFPYLSEEFLEEMGGLLQI